MPITVRDLLSFKERGERFVMLTAYDYPTARILDEAGVPVLLVGDSVGNNVLGYDTTIPVTMDEMLHHCRAVARGASNALVVGDMPFMSFHTSIQEGIANAGRFLKEGGAHAIKLERPSIEVAAAIVDRGIPVMGHIGLGPQSVHAMGGYRVQGRSEEHARKLLDEAQTLDKAGIFALVLEGIPAELAARITEAVATPTIGIGAGPHCDGQVLVINDLLGLGFGSYPKFAKPYADLRGTITGAVQAFQADVRAGTFPDEAHSYR
ncbi:MAG: 3-methyl-2-oxobutanoate hydroxymethyltransferase [Actinobacteria bacterium]|nr:MAG: 3-methyl-2-oxobutanoate hydroxymethyltransferase [Actinomycetota bacterium]